MVMLSITQGFLKSMHVYSLEFDFKQEINKNPKFAVKILKIFRNSFSPSNN